ncbi:hypothetical protein FB451DRAFT_1236344 [Mycena latifolia]|nr:hypothetical protein FB451DRAFT_1236344 [Mycena latifolia]
MLLLKKSSLMIAVALSVSMNFQAANGYGAFFCNDINYTNDCAHWTNLVSRKCYTLDAGHQDKLSSFGPDQGTACNLFLDYHCSNVPALVEYPGSSDLRNLAYLLPNSHGQEMPVNDNVNSFHCFAPL